jgi:dihydrofolate synthase/folylpolyglutamate synthase
MTYAEAIQFLYDLRWFGTKFGLTNTLKLAALAGNPQHRLRFIHVAGTNGKGSTCAMLESVYRAAGLRVGLFTSPHLVTFGERIQVNRRLISEAEAVRRLAELKPLLAQFPPAEHPTFFEVTTVMALNHFAAHKCDLVIWETGLGGRLDATNIVTPLASVITNVQYDHQKWLGETLASIAMEKAGIIKPAVPVVTAAAEPEALQVIKETARHQHAPLTIVSRSDIDQPLLRGIDLPLRGDHQKLNAALAVATIRVLADKIPVSDDDLRAGLMRIDWPGRLQLILRPSGGQFLLDGAHNIGGAETLVAGIKDQFGSVKPSLVLGILHDKDWSAMCRILAPLAGRIFPVRVGSERTATPEQLQDACRKANPEANIVICDSLKDALEKAELAPPVVVTGSLYLVGEALALLEPRETGRPDERPLNEWSARG